MHAKVALLARVKVGNRYLFIPVEIKRAIPVPVYGAANGLGYAEDARVETAKRDHRAGC